jgi:RNA polymerase sigma-70 factor (ECF subfamily)
MSLEITDKEIVTRVGSGDEAAFALLYGRYARPLKHYAFRLVADEQEAEDLVHEAFLRLMGVAKTGLFDPARGTLQAFFYSIVHNLCLDRLRQPKVERPLSGEEIARESKGEFARARVRRAVRVLKRLPRHYRVALLLRVRDGFSYAEIASKLNASEAQVKTWIFRGREAIRRTESNSKHEDES